MAERLRVKAKENCLYNSFAIKHTYSFYGDFLMETTTQTTQSLLEIWNADEGKENSHQGVYFPERIRLEHQLGALLTKELEAPNNRYNDYGYEKVLEEFRSNFEWDTQYNLSVDWELISNFATQELKDLPLEEVNAICAVIRNWNHPICIRVILSMGIILQPQRLKCVIYAQK